MEVNKLRSVPHRSNAIFNKNKKNKFYLKIFLDSTSNIENDAENMFKKIGGGGGGGKVQKYPSLYRQNGDPPFDHVSSLDKVGHRILRGHQRHIEVGFYGFQ